MSARTRSARHRRLDVHRDVRPGPVAHARFAGLRRRRLGARGDPDVADRQGRGRHGSSPHGQGHETAFSQIVADQLGVAVRGRRGSARRHPSPRRAGWTPTARARWRSAAIAIVKAAEKVIAKAKPIAAHLMEAAEDDLEFAAGKFRSAAPRRRWRLGDIALAVFAAHDLPDGVEPNLDSEATYDPENFSFPHGTHLCAVEVDTETGAVAIRKYVCVDDVGARGQSADRGGPGARRTRAGHRAGAVRGRRLRRVGHHAVGVVRRVPGARRADLPTFVTDRTETPATRKPAGRQGGRRGRHDRLDPGGGQLGDRRGPPPRGCATSRCRAARCGCGKPSDAAQGGGQ